MKVINKVSVKLISLFIILIDSYLCKNCPQIQTFHNPLFDDGYAPKCFLRIPNTNIILINTIYEKSFSASVVYYYDISTSLTTPGEIINVVKPDYVIIEMYYISQTDKILISNSEMIIFADPYTLKSQISLPVPKTISMFIVPNTNFAVLTCTYNNMNILDIVSAKIIQTLDNKNSPDALWIYQYYSELITLKNKDQVIITSGDPGLLSWSIDFKTLFYSYNGLVKNSAIPKGNRRRCFAKHPTEDILFLGGYALEIIVLKIVNILTGDTQQLLKIQLNNGSYKQYIIDMMFTYRNVNGSLLPTLWVGEPLSYFYRVDLNISSDYTSVSMKTYYYFNQGHTYPWYKIPENNIVLMPQKQLILIFDISLETTNLLMYFKSDGGSRRFMRQKDGLDLYIILSDYIYLYYRNNTGNLYPTQKPNLTKKARFEFNNFYRVKDCYECLFIKAGTTTDKTSYILTTYVYPFASKDNVLDIQTTYKLLWDNIGLNVDPFFMKDTVWVVLGFPKKNDTDGYLFQLINCNSTTERYLLNSTNAEENKRKTNFAIASVEEKSNLEIIGVDIIGTVYVWDLTIPTLKFKYSIQFSICLNSTIGDVFQYEKLKRLIIACDDYNVYSYDFVNGKAQWLVKLTFIPLALRAFSTIQIVAVGDRYTGDVFIYKFNPNSIQFDFFLKIKTGKFKDVILAIELLNDNTIWIQYNYSNLFYSLQDCLSNKDDCTKCTQSYNFKSTSVYDQNGIYGRGSDSDPFTTSANFFTAMIKAQYYKELVSGVTNMNVDMVVEPNLTLQLQPGLLNFDFNSIISLSFKSKQLGQLATISFYNKLQLQNYNFIQLQDILINFDFGQGNQLCGINLINIPSAILNNTKLKSISTASQSCQQIFVQNTQLSIINYDISDEDFSLNSAIISTSNTTKVKFQNFKLNNCILGDSFSILNQITNVEVNIDNIQITNNKCSNKIEDNEIISSLFSAGFYTIKNVEIIGNTFCKKIIFTTITELQHINQVFDFQDIQVKDNKFQTRTNYLFFNSLYSMRSNPSHELKLTNVSFINNNLIKKFPNDLLVATFVQTNKILKCTINKSQLINHFDIQFGMFDFANQVNIDDFACQNDEQYISTIPDQITTGCLQLNEVNQITINKIRILRKKANDYSLFVINNQIVKQANLQINDGKFSSLILNQSSINSYVNPLHISSSYEIMIKIDDCHFSNNLLTGVQDSITYSTSAIWIENFVGTTQIQNSSFQNSYSNSIYGFIYIQTQALQIDNVAFKNSTFVNTSPNSQGIMFLQNGSMMNIKAQTILIQNSNFQQATANKGSFIYIQSFRKQLNVDIKKTQFTEGYAKQDGSCMFIDTSGYCLIFNCLDCIFNNLYSFNPQQSAIGIEKYSSSKTNEQNIINFTGGNVVNVFGQKDNYFIEAINSQIQFNNINYIETEDFISISVPHQEYMKLQIQQQSTLMNLFSSIANIKNCNFKKLKINNLSATFPLLINSDSSEINIENTSVEESNFVTSVINSQNTTLVLKQIHVSRILDENQEIIPKETGSSLIIIQGGQLQVEQQSNFTDISCSNNCNGGIFQLIKSNFSIQDTNIMNSNATFGGSIFVSGIQKQNLIQNVNFNGCKSQNDGGAIYLHSGSSDKFQLKIDNSTFERNESIKGKGGAIAIISDIMNSPFQFVIIQNSTIVQNSAQIGGGLQLKNISPLIDEDTKIENNVGQLFGNDSISYPSHLKLSNLNEFLNINANTRVENDMIIIDNFRSGAQIQNLIFEFFNDNNEKIIPITQTDINKYSINVQFNPNTQNIKSYSINNETNIKYNKSQSIFQFKELELIGTPSSSAFLSFTSDQIQVLNKKTNKYEQTYSFQIKINFRNCTTGEQFSDFNGLVQCQICEEGYYSLYAEPCQECPDGAICIGGQNFNTKEGYWRKTNESSLVIKCSNLLENCAGGQYGDNICYEGHIGALCEECDIYGEQWGYSYSKSGKYSCIRCDKIKNNLWIVVLLTLWTLISMTLAIRGDIRSLMQKVALQSIQKNIRKRVQSQNSMTRSKASSFSTKFVQNNFQTYENIKKVAEDRTGIYIKMLTNYIQIVGSIATFNLAIPSGVFEFPQSIGQPLKQTMNSLDCVLKDFDTTIPIIYLRLIFSLFLPIFYMLVFFIGISTYTLAIRSKKFPWYILSTASMFLIIYIQPDLVAQIIALMSCRTVGETGYILSNVSFECQTDEHTFYTLVLITPLLFVWVFILPIILFLMIRKNKDKLDTIETKLKYGFLYREYKHNSFYWEFVKMTEKIAIILSLNFYSQSVVIKAVLVFMIIVIYGILSLIIEPYQDSDINQLDINSTNVCAITVLLGLFIYDNPYEYFVYTSFALIIIINVWFMSKLLKKIISGYILRIKLKIQYICELLSKRIPFFKKFVRKEKQKTINQDVKKKVQSIFKSYLEKDPDERKSQLLKIVESQLAIRHSSIFNSKQIIPETQKEAAKESINPSNNINHLQFHKTQSLIQQNDPNQFSTKGTININNIEFSPTATPQIIMSSGPSILNLQENDYVKNNDIILMDSDCSVFKSTAQSPKRLFNSQQVNQIDTVQEDKLEVNFHESQDDIDS